MRTLLLLALLLLLKLPALAQNTELRARPINFDDTIVLTLPDEGRAAWQRTGRLLAQRGYVIRFASPELLTLSTEVVANRGEISLGVALVVDGHELRLQGYTDRGSASPSGVNSSSWLGLVSYADGGGQRARQWQELEAVALLLGGTRQYARSGPN